MITVQSLVNWEVDSELWELMMIHSTDDWQKYMQAALERGWPLAILVQIQEKTQNKIQHCADQGTPSIQHESEETENQNMGPQGLADEGERIHSIVYERLAVGRPFVSHEPYHGGMYGDEEDERPTMGTIWI